jgi:signal transduction histidine kinase
MRPFLTLKRSFFGRGRRLSGGLLLVSALLDGWFAIALASSNGDVDPWVNIGLAQATQWVPVVLFWVVAARFTFRRAEIVLAAAALTFSAMGDLYYSVAMGPDGYLASPSPADIGYLLFYPLMVGSLIVFSRRHIARMRWTVALDAAVASLGAAALIAALLSPVLSDAVSGTNVAAALVNIAYPLFDLVLIAAIAGIASVPAASTERRWGWLVAGLLVTAVADVVYALLDQTGAYIAGTPLDATWAVGLTLIAGWAHWLGADTAPTGDAPGGRVRVAALPVTALGFVAGLALLLVATRVEVSLAALILATATVVLAAVPVLLRQAVLGRLLSDQQRVIDDAERLDKSKNEMLATMNHELRTPLTSIVGYVELVRDGNGGEIPPEADGMLCAVEDNALRMQKLIDDMVVITRLDAGGHGRVFSDVAIAELLAEVEMTVRGSAATRGVVLSCGPVEPSTTVRGDREQLRRALVNLVENAIKFTGSGGSVDVTAERSVSQPSNSMSIAISDTGMGIPVEDIGSLGTRLFRASNARSSAVPGAGLGLAIAQEIVEAHGGNIAIESQVGRGSVFRVRLPLTVMAAPRAERLAAPTV